MLAVLALLAAAAAQPVITITAEVSPHLRTISGTMTLSEPMPLTDPLGRLPEPPDNLQLQRTYPGAANTGSVTWTGTTELTFETTLPKRWGAIGWTPKHGAFANGGWYPQPEGLPISDWTVELSVPEGSMAVVGQSWGGGTLTWSGTGDRVSMAVLPRGRATPLDVDGVDAVLLTRGKPRAALVRELNNQLDRVRPAQDRYLGVVVEAPLRRRLSRGGLGVAYVSDRAWRVSPGLHRYHHIAATRGVVSGLLAIPDPFERDVAAAALSVRHASKLKGAHARDTLRWAQWIPTIDALLNDRRMPFVADVLEDAHPGDPVRDDIAEMLQKEKPSVDTSSDSRLFQMRVKRIGEPFNGSCDQD